MSDGINWTSYKIDKKQDKIAVFTSIVSTKIPFKGTSKGAVVAGAAGAACAAPGCAVPMLCLCCAVYVLCMCCVCAVYVLVPVLCLCYASVCAMLMPAPRVHRRRRRHHPALAGERDQEVLPAAQDKGAHEDT